MFQQAFCGRSSPSYPLSTPRSDPIPTPRFANLLTPHRENKISNSTFWCRKIKNEDQLITQFEEYISLLKSQEGSGKHYFI